MAESPNIGLRLPQHLLNTIDSLKGKMGATRTEVIVNLLELGLSKTSNSDDIAARLAAIEKKLGTLSNA